MCETFHVTLLFLFIFILSICVSHEEHLIQDPDQLITTSNLLLRTFTKAAVNSEDQRCSNIGKDVLERLNGSAVDAAVAVALCIGVVCPQSSGIGGGLFMTVFNRNQIYAINARETAPARSNSKYYKENPGAAVRGAMSVGVPGEIAGLWDAHVSFGRVKWGKLVEPARLLAQEGYIVSPLLGKAIQEHWVLFEKDAVMRSEFSRPNGQMLQVGDLAKRPRLAETLRMIETNGYQGFYRGIIAKNFIEDMNRNVNGSMELADLYNFLVDWTDPMSYKFKNNLTLYSLPFPSGSPVVTMALGILETFGTKNFKEMSNSDILEDLHILAETLKFAGTHRHRSSDPRFTDAGSLMNKILTQEYIENLSMRINTRKTFHDPHHYGGMFKPRNDGGTAHISIIDQFGDAVSLTTTINHAWGAGFMGNLTGIIFNNEIDDFSFEDQMDAYGLSPNPANAIQPGKRPASSMSPIIILDSSRKPYLITGGSGGTKIVPGVISTAWRILFRGMSVKEAADFPRLMPMFIPPRSQLHYEYGISQTLLEGLQAKGHETQRIDKGYWAAISHLLINNRTIYGCADFRKRGDVVGF